MAGTRKLRDWTVELAWRCGFCGLVPPILGSHIIARPEDACPPKGAVVFVYARENEFCRVGIRNLHGISCAHELPRSEFFSLGFGKRRDASASRTRILARSKRYFTAPTVMFKTHAVSAVLRFLTS